MEIQTKSKNSCSCFIPTEVHCLGKHKGECQVETSAECLLVVPGESSGVITL